MKFSATDWSFYGKCKSPETYYNDLKSLGYDGVEMVDQSRWQAARKAGLEIINLSGPGMEQGLNQTSLHKELIPAITDCIAMAGENNIPQVIVFSGNRNGQDDDTGINNCCIALEKLLPIAEKSNVILTFEMLNSYNHVDYQADSGKYGFKLAEKLNHPSFKLIYDIFHMERMGCNAAAEIAEHVGVIGHIHLAESPDRGIPLANGNIKYCNIVPKVIKAGYTGYWGMEFMPAKESLAELEAARNTFLAITAG